MHFVGAELRHKHATWGYLSREAMALVLAEYTRNGSDVIRWGCHEERFAGLVLAAAQAPVDNGVVTFDCWDPQALAAQIREPYELMPASPGSPISFKTASPALAGVLGKSGALFARKFMPGAL